jgi:hypothetical protein
MLARRMVSRTVLRSLRRAMFPNGSRSSTGMTRSLQIIVERAMVSMITMPVAADIPPIKTSRARASWRMTIGSVKTKVSASTSPVKCIAPPKAIGRTKRLMASR